MRGIFDRCDLLRVSVEKIHSLFQFFLQGCLYEESLSQETHHFHGVLSEVLYCSYILYALCLCTAGHCSCMRMGSDMLTTF